MEKRHDDTTSFISSSTHPAMEAFLAMAQLKNLHRQGWLQRGVGRGECESVADHSFGVAMLGHVLAHEYRPDLDATKVMMLGLFHEIGEIYAGDVTPRDGITREDKTAKERESAQAVSSHLLNPEKYLALWEEFENRQSPEAVFVGEVDKLEMLMQARLYEKLGHGDLDEFFSFVRDQVTSTELSPVVDAIIRPR